ncbi:MAG: hypothetical protein H6511_07380 [Holophagales bacterium]|nr:hypothetical protein [Holophagales bacterium]
MRLRAIPLLLFLSTILASPSGAAVLVVSAADFHNGDGSGHAFTDFSGWIQKGGGTGYLIAPVALPDGVAITSVSAWLGDSEPTGDFAIQLLRKRRGNSVPSEEVARVDTAGIDPSGQQLVTAAAPVHAIVDDNYLYYLSTVSNPLDTTSQRLYSVQVNYLPLVGIFSDDFESGDTSAWGAAPPAFLTKWISAASFSPGAKTPSWPWVFDSALGTYSLPNATGSTPPCGVAPLELPHGATVAGFLANLYDSRADRGLTLNLRRSPINSMVVSSVMASASTSSGASWQLRSDLSVTDPVIDNDSFWYYFELCMTGGITVSAGQLAVQAVQVLYSAP